MKKVVCLAGSIKAHQKYFDDLCKQYDREADYVDFNTREEFIEYAKHNDIDIIVSTWPGGRKIGSYSNEMIRQIGPGVRAVCHCGAGYDVLGDVHEWKNAGVQVANCPNAPAADTADTAMFLLLGAIRNFNCYSTALKKGQWRSLNPRDYDMLPGRSPSSLTLGILGMGNIGAYIRDRAEPFGFQKIQYFKRNRLPVEQEKGAEYIGDLDEFLRTSDAIVVVVPHNKSTHHLLNRERLFNVVKEHCTIVNVARGPVIDEAALADALESGRIFTVGLDVFEFEPDVNPKLLASNQALLTPHLGTHTDNAWNKFELEIIENVESVLKTGKVISLVPEHR